VEIFAVGSLTQDATPNPGSEVHSTGDDEAVAGASASSPLEDDDLEFLAIHVFGCGLVEEGLAVIFDGLLVLRGDLRGGIFDLLRR
jgi:hypothetical protein